MTITAMATMMRIPICKKKREERKKRRLGEKEERKEEGKYILQKRGLKKKRNLVVDRRIYPVWGRGNGCPRLKVLQVPEKNAPPP